MFGFPVVVFVLLWLLQAASRKSNNSELQRIIRFRCDVSIILFHLIEIVTSIIPNLEIREKAKSISFLVF